MRKFLVFAGMVLAFGILASESAQSQPTEYVIAVVPQYTPLATYEAWKPLCDYLNKETGNQFRLKVSNSIPEFEKDILAGTFDFAFISPYYQVKTKKSPGYIPLVRDSSALLIGIIVVRKDDPLKSIRELNGEKMAVPSMNAFGASLYPRALLKENEDVSLLPVSVKSHNNVYRHVIGRNARVGGGVRRTLQNQPPEVREQLRIIYETPGITPHPFSAHPRVPESVREDVKKAILSLYQTEEGQKILENITVPHPVAADYERDYESLEALNLDQYWAPESDKQDF